MSKLLLSVGLVFAVTAAGWSGVVAAGLCPHAGCAAEAVAARRADAHCHTSPSADGHSAASDQPEHEGHGEAADAGRAHHGSVQGALGRHRSTPCAHCVESPQAPAKDSPKVARSEARRDADAPRAVRRMVLTAASSFPALAPSQGSPPAPAARRKHLVFSTFLI